MNEAKEEQSLIMPISFDTLKLTLEIDFANQAYHQ